jgi:FixJ family two-component response regulator
MRSRSWVRVGDTDISATVAIVDDDLAVRRALARLLRSCGVRAELFASAEDFLAERGDREFALLVVDVVMADLGGLDLLETLAAKGTPQRAVVITAHDTELTRERARRLGAPLIRKPIEGEELLAVVGEAIGREPNIPRHDRQLEKGD